MNTSGSLTSSPTIIRDRSLVTSPGLAIAVLPNSKQVLSSGYDFHLHCWDIERQTIENSWDARGPIYSIGICPRANIAMLGAVQGVVLWDLGRWDLCGDNTLWSHSLIHDTAYSEITGEVLGVGEDTTIHRWNLHRREKIGQLPGHDITITAVDIDPSGHLAATGDLNGIIRLWDMEKTDYIKSWQGHTKKVVGLKLSSDGRFALSGSEDGYLILWELISGKVVVTVGDLRITDIALGKDARQAFSCGEENLSHWDLTQGALIGRYSKENITTISLSPDGNILAGLVKNNHVLVWDHIVSG